MISVSTIFPPSLSRARIYQESIFIYLCSYTHAYNISAACANTAVTRKRTLGVKRFRAKKRRDASERVLGVTHPVSGLASNLPARRSDDTRYGGTHERQKRLPKFRSTLSATGSLDPAALYPRASERSEEGRECPPYNKELKSSRAAPTTPTPRALMFAVLGRPSCVRTYTRPASRC